MKAVIILKNGNTGKLVVRNLRKIIIINSDDENLTSVESEDMQHLSLEKGKQYTFQGETTVIVRSDDIAGISFEPKGSNPTYSF